MKRSGVLLGVLLYRRIRQQVSSFEVVHSAWTWHSWIIFSLNLFSSSLNNVLSGTKDATPNPATAATPTEALTYAPPAIRQVPCLPLVHDLVSPCGEHCH